MMALRFIFQVKSIKGELTLGGYNPNRVPSGYSLFSVPLKERTHWLVNMDSFSVGNVLIGSNVPAIVDTGSTLLVLPEAMYNTIITQSRAIIDPQTSWANVDCASVPKLPTLWFNFMGTRLSLTGADYANFNFKQGMCGLGIMKIGFASEKPILGVVFLRKYYTVFDGANSRVQFAVPSNIIVPTTPGQPTTPAPTTPDPVTPCLTQSRVFQQCAGPTYTGVRCCGYDKVYGQTNCIQVSTDVWKCQPVKTV